MNNEIKGGLGNSYTAQFWEYDSRIGRRWNLDPKPMVGISDYSVFRNRPLAYVDTNGDTTIHATPDGKFIDADNTGGGIWIATGNYAASRININIGTIKKPKYEERVINVFNTINLYKVNDPAVDIQQLSAMQQCDQVLTFVSDENINWIMDRSNIKKRWLPNRWGFAYNQSVDGKMDFNYSYTLPSLGIVTTTPNAADYDRVGGFMIMGDPNKAVIAYNLNDAGQWLWGHAMMRLGFGIGTAMQAANRNSIQSGYGPDTEADQNAIGQGFLYKTGTTQLNQGTIFNPTFNHRRDNREDNNLIRKSDRNSIRF